MLSREVTQFLKFSLTHFCLLFVVNLAAATADIRPSLRVGLLDADVFGPSIPLMMNLSGEPLVSQGKLT